MTCGHVIWCHVMTGLVIVQSHPARDAHDTFFIKDPASALVSSYTTVRFIFTTESPVWREGVGVLALPIGSVDLSFFFHGWKPWRDSRKEISEKIFRGREFGVTGEGLRKRVAKGTLKKKKRLGKNTACGGNAGTNLGSNCFSDKHVQGGAASRLLTKSEVSGRVSRVHRRGFLTLRRRRFICWYVLGCYQCFA